VQGLPVSRIIVWNSILPGRRALLEAVRMKLAQPATGVKLLDKMTTSIGTMQSP
jgi:hypothetical protein